MEPIHIFVGTDQRMARAEVVLEHSIRKHSDHPFVIHWMRAGDEDWDHWVSQPSQPYAAKNRGEWATQFSGFRLAVPELCRDLGIPFGIYVDADMMFLAPIEELYAYKTSGFWCHPHGAGVSVAVMDATAGRVPPISEMRRNAFNLSQLLRQQPLKANVPAGWNSVDKLNRHTKLLHFSNMHTQVWKPWPDRFPYDKPHPDADAAALFFEYEQEAIADAEETNSVS